MKFIVVILIVLAVVWLWRSSRRDDEKEERSAQAGKAPPPASPQDMVQCPVCSVHLPRTDALPGPDGRLYCCAEHRQRGES